jgi:protein SCO1/2
MNRNIKLTVISCLVIVALIFVLTYVRITRNNAATMTMSPEQLRDTGALVYDAPVNLREFTLQDHRAQVFTQENLKGAWSLIFFGFTSCPDICPLTLTELSQFYGALETNRYADDTRVIMVSVDPIRDSTDKLADYMSSFHPSFIGLNGPYEEIASLARQLYISHTPPPVAVMSAERHEEHAGHGKNAAEDYLIDHSGNILIINPQGQYIGFFDAAIQDRELTLAYEAIRAVY